MVKTQVMQETVLLTPLDKDMTSDMTCPERKDWMCQARRKSCRVCGHRFPHTEHELWNCPDCGEDRHCQSPKVTGYNVCTKHGGAAPNQGRLIGKPRSHRYTDVLSSDMVRDYRAGLSDPELLVLRDEIALCDARKKSLIRRAIACELDDTEKSDALWNQANKLQEQGRKLRKTETDRLVKLQQYITKERAVAFTRAVAVCHQESIALIPDDKLRLQVRNAFEVRLSRVMQTKRADLIDLLVEVPK